jgi:hypothetical protein
MVDDPLEELSEVYAEVHLMEEDFKKTIDMCSHLLRNSKEMF